MIRQRVHLRRVGLGEGLLRVLVTLLAAALVVYGAAVLLAALKLAPHTINAFSGYRTVRDHLSSITPAQITGRDRVIVAAAGVAALLLCAPVAWRALPRPYLARTGVTLDLGDGDDGAGPAGRTDMGPRAIERAAELAAQDHEHVSDAAAVCRADGVDVRVQLVDAPEMLSTLRAVQVRVRDGLRELGLPDRTTIDVTFGGASSPTTKESRS